MTIRIKVHNKKKYVTVSFINLIKVLIEYNAEYNFL